MCSKLASKPAIASWSSSTSTRSKACRRQRASSIRAGTSRALTALLPRAGRRCDVDRATLYAPAPQGRDADAAHGTGRRRGLDRRRRQRVHGCPAPHRRRGHRRPVDGQSLDRRDLPCAQEWRRGTRSAIASHRAASTRPSSRARAWRARSEVRNTVTAARRRSCESPRACAPRPAACRGAGIYPSRGRRRAPARSRSCG